MRPDVVVIEWFVTVWDDCVPLHHAGGVSGHEVDIRVSLLWICQCLHVQSCCALTI